MGVRLKNGAVFLHVPKTGGGWVSKVLNELGLAEAPTAIKHADMAHHFGRFYRNSPLAHLKAVAADVLSPLRSKPFVFCFVRHPVSWYESWFRFMAQPRLDWMTFGRAADPRDWHPTSMLNGTGAADFSDFVLNVIERRPGFVTELFGWYTTPEIDFIGKQENLAEDLVRVLELMDLKFDKDLVMRAAPFGVGEAPANPIIWRAGLKEEVRALEYAGIVRYGYRDFPC